MRYKNITSIIMPTMAHCEEKREYIKWTLDSLDRFIDKPFELIIINNKHTDSSNKFLKRLIKKFEKNKHCTEIKLIGSKRNLGWTGGIEKGIRESEGKYVCFINDDLIFSKNWLSKMIKHIRGDIAAVGPTSNFVAGRQLVKFNRKDLYEEKANYLIGLCFLVKREALVCIREKNKDGNEYYIDPQFYPGGSEELDLCIRLNRAGYEMVIARDVFIGHFGNRTLQYLKEFNQSQDDFYGKRLKLLEEKHGREAIDILNEFQLCPKIAIGIPSIGYTNSEFMAMYPWVLQDAWARFGSYKVLPILSPRNLVHIGRNEIIKKALEYGCEYIFFFDDDEIAPPDIIWKLYSHHKDFISAIVYCRISPYRPCVYNGKDKDGNWKPDITLGEGLIRVDSTGLGCALIKMSAVKKLIRKRIKQINKRGGLFHFTKYGEDMNFTEELKRFAKIELWADTDIVVKHLGQPIKVDSKTFMDYNTNKEVK